MFPTTSLFFALATVIATPQQPERDVRELLAQAERGYFAADPTAVQSSRRAIELLAGSSDHRLQVRAHSVHGRALLERGQMAPARKSIERALDVCGRHLDDRATGEPHLAFAFWFARSGFFGRAAQHAKFARKQFGGALSPRQAAELSLVSGTAWIARGAHPTGMPTLYDAVHAPAPVNENPGSDTQTAEIVGPVCETGDILASDVQLPALTENDLLYLKSAGAYGAVMASSYNSRQLIPEIMVNHAEFSIIRPRPSFDALLSLDHMPNWL